MQNSHASDKTDKNKIGQPPPASDSIPEPAFTLIATSVLKALDQAQEKHLRVLAEWDNARKRLIREKEEAIRYAAETLLENLLPIIDNFELGLQAAENAGDQNILLGFKMVHGQLQQFLKENGITPIDAVGQPFDPHLHEASQHIPTNEYPEGTVIAQIRRGYKLHDRLLRPALVNVAQKMPPSS
ncbi:MAG: nucleotide exchange factor GrpE [Methylacidiphilales bacterium]|nr:nucleotide exchange factor GrpE [Candidatus Methylacidiphilales bacterium]MDW8349355.1 nucleotide exchange factor GrpE [Verrucomicrobiae bacterium]